MDYKYFTLFIDCVFIFQSFMVFLNLVINISFLFYFDSICFIFYV